MEDGNAGRMLWCTGLASIGLEMGRIVEWDVKNLSFDVRAFGLFVEFASK